MLVNLLSHIERFINDSIFYIVFKEHKRFTLRYSLKTNQCRLDCLQTHICFVASCGYSVNVFIYAFFVILVAPYSYTFLFNLTKCVDLGL